MSSGEGTTSYNDNWNLDSDIVREVTRKDDTQIHTRVMVEDTAAVGYQIDSASIRRGSYFEDFNAEQFKAKLLSEYPEFKTNNSFINIIEAQAISYSPLEIQIVLIATMQGRTYQIEGSGSPDDPLYRAKLQQWGITLDAGFGRVVYYIDPQYTTTATVHIHSQEEIMGLSPGETATTGWMATIGGKRIPNDAIKEVQVDRKTTVLPVNFLYGCQHLTSMGLATSNVTVVPDNCCRNSSILSYTLPNVNHEVGDNFCRDTILTGFASPNASTTKIGKNFMRNCKCYGTINLFSSLQSIGTGFLYNCNATNSAYHIAASFDTETISLPIGDSTFLACIDSSAAAIRDGVRVNGSAQAFLRSAFPNSSTSPYRNLIEWSN